jgi:hypothetical protein
LPQKNDRFFVHTFHEEILENGLERHARKEYTLTVSCKRQGGSMSEPLDYELKSHDDYTMLAKLFLDRAMSREAEIFTSLAYICHKKADLLIKGGEALDQFLKNANTPKTEFTRTTKLILKVWAHIVAHLPRPTPFCSSDRRPPSDQAD